MPVSKDFRVKKGLVVGENIDATSGNLSAIDIDASGTFSAGTFEPSNVTATGYVSSPSISADNIWGNIKDVTYSELSITGGLSSDGINLTDADGTNSLGFVDAVSADALIGETVTLFTIPTAKYRSGKALLQAVSDTYSWAEASEFIYVQHGSTIKWTEYASVGIGETSRVAEWSASIVGDNVEIKALNWTGNTITVLGSISQLYAVT